MSARLLIRAAEVVFPDQVARANVLVDGGRIVDVDAAGHAPADEVVDAQGLHLLPGAIDGHVHFRQPGAPHKEDIASGSRACARGGVTTFLEMPNTNPATTTIARLHEKLATAAESSRVHYGFFLGATADNLGELQRAERTPGIKLFLGSSTGDLLVDDEAALHRIFAETTLPLCGHCEDEATIAANRERIGPTHDVRDHSRIRDRRAAITATRRAIDLARQTRRRFHVLHVSTAEEVDLIRQAGPRVATGEACPHHLLLDESDYDRLGTRAQMNPALKTAADRAALWQGLRDGVLRVVGTDHAPHTPEEKARPYPESPSGVPGVENLLPLLLNQIHEGRCTLQNVVRWTAANPARLWGLTSKGRIAVNSDADLVLVDLQREHTIRDEQQVTRCGWSPWHGTTLRGAVLQTWVAGRALYREGRFDDSVRGREATFDHAAART